MTRSRGKGARTSLANFFWISTLVLQISFSIFEFRLLRIHNPQIIPENRNSKFNAWGREME
ncbi:MAG: hypothetical protein D6679_03320 [Candidatus Hydrogenedentota bacterium]|nr:MAG: hypothetical protein D6679_03320 [Candidatus Hydrogenedentota bacterium]